MVQNFLSEFRTKFGRVPLEALKHQYLYLGSISVVFSYRLKRKWKFYNSSKNLKKTKTNILCYIYFMLVFNFTSCILNVLCLLKGLLLTILYKCWYIKYVFNYPLQVFLRLFLSLAPRGNKIFSKISLGSFSRAEQFEIT